MNLYSTYVTGDLLPTPPSSYFFQLSLLLLKHTTKTDQLVVILDTLRRYRLIWVCMGVVDIIVRALYTAHQTFAANGIHSRPLAELLLELDGERYLSASDRQDVIEKSVALSQVRGFRVPHPPIPTDNPSETLPLERASRHRP